MSKKQLTMIFAFLLLGTLALSVILLRQPNMQQSIVTLFNSQRNTLPASMDNDLIFPDNIGNYHRVERELIGPRPDAPNQYRGSAIYERNSGSEVSIIVYSTQPLDLYQRQIVLSALTCGEIIGTTEVHLETRVSFRFGKCESLGFSSYDLMWLNGNWIIDITVSSTYNSDINTLVEFASTYPY
jgi:hypothetical protein